MEKYQYLRLAEERSMDLAEFLRGHIIYYQRQGENLERIFHHPEVLRRVVVEFGTMPELREVTVHLDSRRASFRYTKDREVKEEIVRLPGPSSPEAGTGLPNSFRMISLPLESNAASANRIEFVGTMDYINEYIGKYLMLIYLSFTVMVALATAIIGIIVIDTDRRFGRQYAELQEAHQHLAQAAKLASVGQLAGGVAHEINTPITSILSLASHLAEGKGGTTLTSSQRRSFQIIAQQAERVSKTVGNLLTFSRQSSLELTRIDVEDLLETAITLVQYRLKDGSIRFLRDIKPDLPPVLGDPGRLTEVFVNLLNNSLDSMPKGGKVTVRAYATQEPDSAVRVEITDTGCGIPSEIQNRVFDPFFTTKEPGKGTGLGLSISHGIVKDHGGEIWAQSRPGEGTTAVVTLPRGGEWR
jgi:signal transduction histidine kinase